MKLLTKEQKQKMLENGRTNARLDRAQDFEPVVKLFCPWDAATWLLSEINPRDHDVAFGLCDLGMGFPELGNVRLTELVAVQGPGGLRIERDLHFKPKKTLRAYADDARQQQRIVA